ncbi:hypothetical protein FB451DRAFT_1559404 [Mycena latifolia]|nr:hypothetical protein FB451DRAFT_1559404 [Mycena latifolia]
MHPYYVTVSSSLYQPLSPSAHRPPFYVAPSDLSQASCHLITNISASSLPPPIALRITTSVGSLYTSPSSLSGGLVPLQPRQVTLPSLSDLTLAAAFQHGDDWTTRLNPPRTRIAIGYQEGEQWRFVGAWLTSG